MLLPLGCAAVPWVPQVWRKWHEHWYLVIGALQGSEEELEFPWGSWALVEAEPGAGLARALPRGRLLPVVHWSRLSLLWAP